CGSLDPEDPKLTACILLYPNHGPESSSAVTRGVQCDVGVLFIPTVSPELLRTVSPLNYFSYSVKFSLLGEAEQRARIPGGSLEHPMSSTQLLARHWVVRDGSGSEDEVLPSGRHHAGLSCASVCSQRSAGPSAI
ncbi:F-box protein skip16, partial [Cymbomonas tetramitiformis]